MYEPVSLDTLSRVIPEREETEIAAALVAANDAKLAIKYFSEEGEPLLKLSGNDSEHFALSDFLRGSFLYEADKDSCLDLLAAVWENDIRKVKRLLRSTDDINGITIRYRIRHDPPLIAAVYKDSVELIPVILEAGADVDFCDRLGNSALIVSAVKSIEVTRLLIEAGAEINAQGQYGGTVLSGHLIYSIERVSLLLEAGADPNIQMDSGVTLLFSAVRDGEVEILSLLLSHGATPNLTLNNGYSPLMSAARSGRYEFVKMLLEAGADVQSRNDEGTTALAEGAAGGELRIVEALLRSGSDINANTPGSFGHTPLMRAVIHEHADIVRELIAQGADINPCTTDGQTALDFAKGEEIKTILLRGK